MLGSLEMQHQEALSFDKLERGVYGPLLQSLMRTYQRSDGAGIQQYEHYIPFGALCAPTAPAGRPPRLLHVGENSMLANHYGRKWLADPTKWNVAVDPNLERVAAFGYEEPIAGEPSIYELSVSHENSRFGAYDCIYRRLCFPLAVTDGLNLIFQASVNVCVSHDPNIDRPTILNPREDCRLSHRYH